MIEHRVLKQRTFFSIVWTVARVGWTSLVSLIIFAVLARKLNPGIFGVYALATILVDFMRIIASAGLTETIIREPAVDEELADTAFWSGVLISLFAAAAVVLLAGPYAALVAQPKVVPVLWALAIFIPVTSLGAVHLARKLGQFGHKAVTLRVMGGSLLGGGAAIVCAYRGMGVWSLVVQVGISEVVGVILAWQAFKWVPRLHFSPSRFRSLLNFNGNVIVSQSIWMLMVRIQEIFIGRTLGTAAVGNYRVAWRMMELIRQAITAPIGSVALVTFSHLRDVPARFNAAYRRMLGLICLLTFPLIFGYGVLSDEIVHALFGNKWAHAAPVAQVLALMAVPLTLNYFLGPAVLAKGASHANTMAATVQLLLTAVLSYLAAPYGVVAVAGAYVFRAYLTMPYQQYLVYKYAGIHPLESLKDVWPPLLASLCMVGALILAAPLLHLWFGRNALILTASICFGALVYGAGLFVFGRSLVVSQVSEIRSLFGGGTV